jgi:hypothetical protein
MSITIPSFYSYNSKAFVRPLPQHSKIAVSSHPIHFGTKNINISVNPITIAKNFHRNNQINKIVNLETAFKSLLKPQNNVEGGSTFAQEIWKKALRDFNKLPENFKLTVEEFENLKNKKKLELLTHIDSVTVFNLNLAEKLQHIFPQTQNENQINIEV